MRPNTILRTKKSKITQSLFGFKTNEFREVFFTDRVMDIKIQHFRISKASVCIAIVYIMKSGCLFTINIT